MRVTIMGAALVLLAGAAQAAPAETGGGAQLPPLGPPSAFSGYNQPDITPGLCKKVNESSSQCVIPAMTAGRYYIEASGTSTAAALGAAQQLEIVIGDTQCPIGTRGVDATWKTGTPRTFKFGCVTTIITDRPLTVQVGYRDEKATKDPKGPTLSIRRLPWGGVMTVTQFIPAQ